MREILFRGKTRTGEWVYGYYVFSPAIRKATGQVVNPTNFDTHHIVTKKFNAAREIFPETVGQYTGLTDKNGKRIFEGDIVKGKHDWVNWNTSLGNDEQYFLEQKIRSAYGKCIDKMASDIFWNTIPLFS